MAFVKASDLRALLDQVSETAILEINLDDKNGKVNFGVIEPEQLRGCNTGGCGSCETPCEAKDDQG